MCAEPQTECMLNSTGITKHIVKFSEWWQLYFGFPCSLCKIHFLNRYAINVHRLFYSLVPNVNQTDYFCKFYSIYFSFSAVNCLHYWDAV